MFLLHKKNRNYAQLAYLQCFHLLPQLQTPENISWALKREPGLPCFSTRAEFSMNIWNLEWASFALGPGVILTVFTIQS